MLESLINFPLVTLHQVPPETTGLGASMEMGGRAGRGEEDVLTGK